MESRLLYMITTKFQRLCFGVRKHGKTIVGILSDVWACRKSKMAAINRKKISYVWARTHDSNEISTVTPTFMRSSNLRSSNSVELVPMLPDVSGSRKSKMAAVKPEVYVSQLVDMIESKLHRHQPCVFEDDQLNGTTENVVRRKRKSKIKDDRR